MTRTHQPSVLHQGIDLLIDPHWSPDQAMAVIELIDDLRERIWSSYESVLHQQFRDDRVTHHDIEIADPPF